MRLSARHGLAVKAAVIAAMLAAPATGVALDRQLADGRPLDDPGPSPADAEVLLPAPPAETPAAIERIPGPLSAPRAGPAAPIVLDFVRRRARAYDLDRGDVDSLRVADSVEWRGLRRVRVEQTHRGIPALQPALTATVAENGAVLDATGAPEPDLATPTVAPGIGAAAAVERILRSVGSAATVRGGVRQPGNERETAFDGGHQASLVLVPAGDSSRLSWAVLAFADSRHILRGVVDAATGAVLERRNLVSGATALAFSHYPDAPGAGGVQEVRTLRSTGPDPWLTRFDRLEGDNALVYSDENDDIYESYGSITGDPIPMPQTSDHIPPSSGSGTSAAAWSYTPQHFSSNEPTKLFCPTVEAQQRCTWDNFDSTGRDSWQENREQAAVQAFWLVNHFHDHLQDDPSIGFTDVMGNFEEVGDDPTGDGDPVHVQVMDGADTDDFTGPGGLPDGEPDGLPDSEHVNNANMATLPDGISPRMQLYLFSNFFVTKDPSSRVYDVNGADDATIVYHEYAHGLSSRLVCCDSGGFTTLSGAQGGALGEGWSDWYALDLLEAEGLVVDAPSVADVTIGAYENARLRTQPIDCRVGASGDPSCAGWGTAGAGGYTFGDFGRIVPVDQVDNVTGAAGADGVPDGEVHADGEIWVGTLWDLRRALIAAHGRAAGIARARRLITGSMLLVSGTSPDFVDMRDAILRVDEIEQGSADRTLIWGVFAARGLGFGASAAGPNDTQPTESFTDPTVTPTDPTPPQIGPPQPPTTNTTPKPPPPADDDSDDSDGSDDDATARASFRGTKRRLRVNAKRRFSFTFRAPEDAHGAVGFVTLDRVRVRAGSRLRRVRMARAAFEVPAAERVRVRLRLSRAKLALLRRHGSLVLRVTVRLVDEDGDARRSRVKVRLLPPLRR